jgi:2-keto-3-deoxy-L-rhamnonate aldolase RhmA
VAAVRADAILSVKGIDMVQFGGSDYALSLGLTGQRNHPDVKKAERKTIETALKKGLHPRVEPADITQAVPYLEMDLRLGCPHPARLVAGHRRGYVGYAGRCNSCQN